jgi:uncharacterized membrane protein YfcA
VTLFEATLLLAGGLAAGTVNTLAGGGSLLSVPLLVMLGLPGGVANGTNRIGILLQNGVAAWRFRAKGIWDVRSAALELAAVAAGALAGAIAVVQLSDRAFERAFALAMLVLLVPTLRRPPASAAVPRARPAALLRALAFFAIGLYGGAIQAGVGVLLVFALAWAGYDLVRANALKVSINFCFTLLAAPIFVAEGKVAWLPALVLGAGFAAGGELGARLAVRGGERLIRPVLALAVLALAGRMLGLY